ncbi:MAG: HTTM domain-containing protein [Gemmataceae bacterium]|nr:HTTM domain-containing protein [Gemmata sp.]MDW8199154.1 HTTM domain-containing protein [Gemmataceae bacterium]
MATPMIPDTAPEPVARTAWQRWVGFWFPASDPTTLGFIRITTGLLVLYIHLAYTVDLQQFFGSTGWYAHRYIERERHEYPLIATPFWDWDPQSAISAKVPEVPHRRKAVMDFIRGLPPQPAAREQALQFLNRVAQLESPEAAIRLLRWFRRMGTSEAERERQLAALIEGTPPPREYTEQELDRAPFIYDWPQSERLQLAAEVRAFWELLPKGADDPKQITERGYVLNHLLELSPEFRRAFVRFLLNLPADDAARTKKIDYLEYWNNEPEKAVRIGHAIFSLWFHVTDPTQMAIIHGMVLLTIVLFTIGLFTRVTSVLVWLAVVGYIHRTQQVLFGMDTMMNILLFYLMIGNSGAALSVDRLIARYRAARASLARSGTLDYATRVFLAAPPPSRSAGFGLRLIQVHFCFIYMAAGLSKLKGAAWWTGTATWDVMVNPEFSLMQYPWYENAMRAVMSIKPIYHAFIIGGSWFTLFIEIAGPFLLWTRLRWLIMFLATIMHAIIGVMMGLNLFELLMIIMILAFVPDGVIRDRLRGGPDLPKLGFAFNPAAALSQRAAALVAAADVDSQVTFTSESGLASPVLTDPNGQKRTGSEAFTALARSLRLLSAVGFLLWIPGIHRLLAKRFFPEPQPPTTAAPQPRAPVAAS